MSLKFLIVDDDDPVRSLLVRLVESFGYRVVHAVDGIDALEMFDREAPDFLITNRDMPRLNGYDLCRRVRAFSSVPIVMTTGSALLGQDEEELSRLGVVLLFKPFDFWQLRMAIDKLLA